jgi:hypothetical protein
MLEVPLSGDLGVFMYYQTVHEKKTLAGLLSRPPDAARVPSGGHPPFSILGTHALLHTTLFGQKQMASLENLSDLCKNLFPVAAAASTPRTTIERSPGRKTRNPSEEKGSRSSQAPETLPFGNICGNTASIT